MKKTFVLLGISSALSLSGQASDSGQSFESHYNQLKIEKAVYPEPFILRNDQYIQNEFENLIIEETVCRNILNRSHRDDRLDIEEELVKEAQKEISILKEIFGEDEYKKLKKGIQVELKLSDYDLLEVTEDFPDAIQILKNFLHETNTLESLDLSYNILNKLNLSVKEAFEINPHIKSLNLDYNQIEDQDLENINLQNTSFESLKLDRNYIEKITFLLKNNNSLKQLSLRDNCIDNQELKKLINNNASLTSLDVRNNEDMGTHGIRHILLYNHSLIEFFVDCTKKGQQAAIDSFTNANKNRHTFLFKIFDQYDLNINYLETYADLENKKVIDKIVEEYI